ncbi:MAG: type II toxin-antitoxin system VapC family toxin, partial [bacterium]|nr:type II toxin-antitoxin system VapC family toxin [bacterium]
EKQRLIGCLKASLRELGLKRKCWRRKNLVNGTKTYVLDACALIAYLENEEGKDKLIELLSEEHNIIYMHTINLGEVYYAALRNSGEVVAIQILEELKQLPIEFIFEVSYELFMLAGKYKVEEKVSYADSFALALSEIESAELVTTDHHEFDTIEEKRNLKFLWLR